MTQDGQFQRNATPLSESRKVASLGPLAWPQPRTVSVSTVQVKVKLQRDEYDRKQLRKLRKRLHRHTQAH